MNQRRWGQPYGEGKADWKKCVLSLWRKAVKETVSRKSDGSLFQTEGAAKRNALEPNDRLKYGTVRRFAKEDLVLIGVYNKNNN